MPLSTDRVCFDTLSADPGSPVDGEMWYNGTDKRFKVMRNGALTEVSIAAQFPLVEVTSDTTTTSTSYVTLLTSNVTTLANTLVIALAASVSCSSSSGKVSMAVYLDGTLLRAATRKPGQDAVDFTIVTKSAVSAGAHTILVKWKTTAGTAQIRPASNPDDENGSVLAMEVSA